MIFEIGDTVLIKALISFLFLALFITIVFLCIGIEKNSIWIPY